MSSVPELKFDSTQAITYYPKPVIKQAVLVPVQDKFPAFIRPEWDDTGLNPQVFFGSYYLMLDEHGTGRYGSAAIQWEHMHRRVPGTDHGWVKVLCPVGYIVESECTMITLIPDEAGDIQESSKIIFAGTLVIRQPGGEYQFVSQKNQASTYYSPAEADELGLTGMDPSKFIEWAFTHATAELITA